MHMHLCMEFVPRLKSSVAATEIKFKQEDPMKSLRYRMLVVSAVALAAVCTNAVSAVAQNAFHGSFTLPAEVRWQGATLPAGDYTLTMKSVTAPNLIVLEGPNGSSFVSAIVGDRDKISGPSVLIVEHRAGKSSVRELYMALSCLSWKWRERSSVKITERTTCEKSESTTLQRRRLPS